MFVSFIVAYFILEQKNQSCEKETFQEFLNFNSEIIRNLSFKFGYFPITIHLHKHRYLMYNFSMSDDWEEIIFNHLIEIIFII